MKVKIETNNLDYSDWASGATSSDDFTPTNTDASNVIDYGTDPFGSNVLVWKTSGNTDGVSRSYWNNGAINQISLDANESYRFSIWFKATSPVYSDGRLYFGTYHDGMLVVSDKSVTSGSNTYFVRCLSAMDTYISEDEWYLAVGYVRQYGWTGTTVEAALYDSSGNTITDGGLSLVDYQFSTSGPTSANMRGMAPYNAAMTYELLYPRIDKIDGTEPSLSTLLSGEGPWRDVNSTRINIPENNLVDYSNWSEAPYSGTISGSWYEFTANGGSNFRELDTDPFGNETYVWKTSGDTSSFQAGISNRYNSYSATIDPANTYRISIWVKRINTTGSDSSLYFGYNPYSTGAGVRNSRRCTDGVLSTNFYFYTSTSAELATNLPEGEWRLLVGYVRDNTQDYTTNSDYYGKMYDLSGNTIDSESTDYQFYSGTTDYGYLSGRVFAPYNETGNLDISYSLSYPRIDLVDGTEPSIETLLNNEGSWREVTGIRQNIPENNLLDYSDWVDETYNDFTAYSFSDGQNDLILETDPFGNETNVWSCYGLTGDTSFRSGFLSLKKDIDITSDYRYSVWTKREIVETDGNWYSGFYCYDDGDNLDNVSVVETGTETTITYPAQCGSFAQSEAYLPEGEWVLVVGFYRKYGTITGSTDSNFHGRAYTTGGTITNEWETNYAFTSSTKTALLRVIGLYNADNISETYLLYPRIDKIDGTEPSIETLLNNEGSWRDTN